MRLLLNWPSRQRAEDLALLIDNHDMVPSDSAFPCLDHVHHEISQPVSGDSCCRNRVLAHMGRNGLSDRSGWMGYECRALLVVHDGVDYGTVGMVYFVARP